MKLRFLATENAHVPERHQDGAAMARPAVGSAFRYVGRAYDPKADGDKYPVSKEPYECDSDTGEALYLARECRDGSLLPADEVTARAVGVPWKSAAKPQAAAKDGS